MSTSTERRGGHEASVSRQSRRRSLRPTAQIKAAANAVLGSRSIPYAIAVSRGPGDLTERARTACAAGEDIRLYACGGDGTLNEVINGAVGFENAVVTHYPRGSGNDFVKLFDAPDAFRIWSGCWTAWRPIWI